MTSALTPADRDAVRVLLGREPQGKYEVVVRHSNGTPVVLRNAPLLDDGTPMPTRYWLVGTDEVRRIGLLESNGGVDAAEAAVDPGELADAHVRYGLERDSQIPSGHEGPRPSGGVAGTRVGVKCLHAHWAWHLAGGDDPVGRWIAAQFDNKPGLPKVVVSELTTMIRVAPGDDFVIPWGTNNLTEQWLHDADPPTPSGLTNALATVADYVDDLVREHATVKLCTSLNVSGPSITSLARVEVGSSDTPSTVTLQKADAEEIFRLLVSETATARAENPGLAAEHVDQIVASCCIVLAFMRRLGLDRVVLETDSITIAE